MEVVVDMETRRVVMMRYVLPSILNVVKCRVSVSLFAPLDSRPNRKQNLLRDDLDNEAVVWE